MSEGILSPSATPEAIREIFCTSILTRTGGYLKPVCSHSLNPYLGCGFGRSACGEGCYVKFNPWITRGREWGRFVEAKMNAAEVYRKTVSKEAAWARKHRGKFSVFLSSSTDPWQPLEQKYRITRQVLRALQSHPPDRLILQTHSHRMAEDWEDIESLARRCDLRVHVSIEGDRDRLPGLPPPPCSLKDRLELIRQSVARGFFTVACLSPLYPLTDPEAFFARLAETGLRAVILDHFIEGDGTPDGSRTQKTGLPEAMARVEPESVHLSYRDAMVRIARTYLPVGISASGFAGHYHSKR